MQPILFLAAASEPVSRIRKVLLQPYESCYDVQSAVHESQARAFLEQLKHQRAPLALVLVDSELITQDSDVLKVVSQDFPGAKRVVLATSGNPAESIRQLNLRIDSILAPPWSPLEEYVYPILDDLLEDWQASTCLSTSEVIQVVGHERNAHTYAVKQFLAGHSVPYHWSPGVQDPQKPVEDTYPQVHFPDGSILVQPTLRNLADKLDLQVIARSPEYDLVIVGAGPAGLAAAINGASEGLRTLLVERGAPGGQAGSSSRIENYPGFPAGLAGADLARRMVAQVRRFEVEVISPQEVIGIRAENTERVVSFREGHDVRCRAVLLTTGVAYRTLDVPGCAPLSGSGVYYGASLTETEDCRGKEVYIVGGANSAGQAALHFSEVASRVTMVIRSESLQKDMSQYLIEEILERSNIEVRPLTTIKEVRGEQQLEEITLSCQGRADETVPASVLFVFIGAVPQTEWLSDIVARDERGFILTGSDIPQQSVEALLSWPLSRSPYHLETSMPGVFVAGDVRSGSVKRAATGVGEGSMSVPFIHNYLANLR